MKKEGKNIAKSHAAVEKRPYVLQDAVPLLQKVKYAKFDETVEVTLRLGVDPKHADQMVRGTVVLPHGLGKTKTVAVIATGDLARAIKACRTAVQADPAFQAAWAALGLALAISGEDAQAVQALIKVRADGSFQPLFWLGRYWLVTRYQSPEAGLKVLRAALEKRPGFLLARLRLRRGN